MPKLLVTTIKYTQLAALTRRTRNTPQCRATRRKTSNPDAITASQTPRFLSTTANPVISTVRRPWGQGRRNGCEGGGYNFASGASEKFFLTPPPLAYLGGTWNRILQFSLLQLWRLI